jgi:hypothetical protein
MKTSATILLKLLLLGAFLQACESQNEGDGQSPIGQRPVNNSTVWLIPKNEVFDGGPGKDGIPALTNPETIIPGNASFLSDGDLVLGFASGGQARAYPHRILDWHEIINDDLNGVSVAVIYCPLTGTGIGWDRNLPSGQKTTFGVSGLLYNTNVIPYDRATDTNWSQLLLLAVNGDLEGTKPATINLLETTWKTWKELYPNTRVVSTNTGHARRYQDFPYGDYKTNNNAIFFPVSRSDNRLPAKERVLGVIDEDHVKAYSIELFGDKNEILLDTWRENELVIIGNKAKNFIVAFDRKLPDGQVLEFSVVENSQSIILRDQEGNEWDIFGTALSGPRKDQKLKSLPQMMGYWFAWAPFYSSLDLYQRP